VGQLAAYSGRWLLSLNGCNPDVLWPVIREIVQYLVEHPEAKDTLPGIAGWWRPADGAGQQQEAVQKALSFLVSRGFVVERTVVPGQTVYGAREARLREMRDFLRELQGDGD